MAKHLANTGQPPPQRTVFLKLTQCKDCKPFIPSTLAEALLFVAAVTVLKDFSAICEPRREASGETKPADF